MNKLTMIGKCLGLSLFLILGSIQLTAQPLNNYLLFDGIDDYVSLNNMDVSGSAITIEALINSSNLTGCVNNDCRIVSKAVGANLADHYWMLSTVSSGTNTVLRFRLKTNGTTTSQYATIGALSNNTWYHVAATYDGATMKIFLDGIEVGSTPKTGSLTTDPAAEAWIGNNPPLANSRPWPGGIDDVRIWNVARTQAQLQNASTYELQGNEPGLQAYYKFNEPSGQTIFDLTGNNNTVLGSTGNTDTNDPTRVYPNPNQGVTVDLQVFLEGAFDPVQTTMTNDLLQRAVVPTGQPYNNSPWNYPGTEGAGWLPVDYPAGTVDWVLVSLRQSLDPTTEVARVAAVLLQDGTISPFNIDLNNASTPMYIMVEHRNHLPIISATPIPIVNNNISYNFTAENSYNAGLGFGQKQVGTNWMMYGGNADQEGLNRCDINAVDRIYWQSVNGLFGVYNPGDYNLDGDINAADRIVFNDNNGIFTTVPKSTDTTIAGDPPALTCPTPNFVLTNCNLTVNWTHTNPTSTTVNYDLKINGIDPGPSVTYPATSNTVDICNLLGISSGTGSFTVELFYWYDGDVSNVVSAGVCTVNYNYQPTGVAISCPAPSFVLSNCLLTVNWVHSNPTSTTVNYDLRLNGVDPGTSVTYPATSNTIDVCSLLGINSGTGTIDVDLLWWYDGDLNNIDTILGTCSINYDFQPSGKVHACFGFNLIDRINAYQKPNLTRTPTQTFTSISALQNKINALTDHGGAVYALAAGTHYGQLRIIDKRNLTIYTDPNNPATIDATNWNFGINAYNGTQGVNSNLEILNLRITGSLYHGIYLGGDDSPRFAPRGSLVAGNVVFDVARNVGGGIAVRNAFEGAVITVEDNEVYDVSLSNLGASGEGIYIGEGNDHLDYSSNVHIRGNYLHDLTGEAIDIKRKSANILIEYNKINNINVKSQSAIVLGLDPGKINDSYDGQYIVRRNCISNVTTRGFDGNFIVVANGSALVEENVMWNSAKHGIDVYNDCDGPNKTVIIKNNIIWGYNGLPIRVNVGNGNGGTVNPCTATRATNIVQSNPVGSECQEPASIFVGPLTSCNGFAPN